MALCTPFNVHACNSPCGACAGKKPREIQKTDGRMRDLVQSPVAPRHLVLAGNCAEIYSPVE